MAYTDKIIDEFNSDKEETVVEKVPEVVNPEPEKEEPKVEETKAEEKVEEKPEDKPEQPKPDLASLTKEQKAEHAFKRQISKQREKHEAEIADLKASFQKQFDEFKASMQPKEQPKTRADFQNDDEYIAYLANQQVNNIMSERDAKAAKEAADAEEKRKADEALKAENEELSRIFGENSRNAFKDEATYAAYTKNVNRAISNGLGEILDTVPAVRDFIFKNPEGPVVLNRMLTDRDSFVKVMGQTDPTMMIIAAHELAREASAPAPAHVETVQQVPHLGKPGARNTSSDAGSMFGSDRSLMSFVRSVNNRRR
jgi:hypothetical protein